MISFDIVGGEDEAFHSLDRLKLIRLSIGVEHHPDLIHGLSQAFE